MKKIPDWVKLIVAIIICCSTIGIYSTVYDAGMALSRCGEEMMNVRSQAGTTVAEAYYQLHGEVYYHLGIAIANGMGIILIIGLSFSGWLAFPILFANPEIIKSNMKETKSAIHRMAQAVSVITEEQDAVEINEKK